MPKGYYIKDKHVYHKTSGECLGLLLHINGLKPLIKVWERRQRCSK